MTLVCWTQGYWPWWGDRRIPSSWPELESSRALKQIGRGERGSVPGTHKAPPLGCREHLFFWVP